ncbi:hypothetical protein Chor_003613 [Crotalus horridus]
METEAPASSVVTAVKFQSHFLLQLPIRRVILLFLFFWAAEDGRWKQRASQVPPFGLNKLDLMYQPFILITRNPVLTSRPHTCRKLGPGSYVTDNGSFSSTALQKRASSSSWAKAQEAARLTQMPHFKFKEICQQEKARKRKLGPGTYNHTDFLQLMERRPHSIRGICDTGAIRFKDRMRGSGLGPGTYNIKNGVDEMLKRVISIRGPYETFTGDRSKPMVSGHFAGDRRTSELSGCNIKSFLDELETKEKKKHGIFSTFSRDPDCPTERIFWSKIGMFQREQYQTGPGSYDIKPIKRTEYKNQPPFWIGAKRFDRRAYRLCFGNTNPVGVGRYDTTKHEKYPKKLRYRSLYMNEAQRYLSNLEKDKCLQ